MTTKINRDDLVKLIEKLLKQVHTKPVSEKNVRVAYQEFVGDHPDLINSRTWELIYTQGKTSVQLAGEIISASETVGINRRRFSQISQGKGGKRSLGKEMRTALEVEEILYYPQKILKKNKIKLSDPFELHGKIRDRCEKYRQDPDSALLIKEPVDKVADDALNKLVDFLNIYWKSFKRDNPKHWQVLNFLFMRRNKYPDLSFIDIPSSKNKGKQVTAKSIFKAIYAIKKYVFHEKDPFPHLKIKAIKKGKLYKDNKFYYFSFLMCLSVDLLGYRFDPTIGLIKDSIINKVRPIMAKLPSEIQLEIVNSLIPRPAYTKSIVE